MKTEKVVRNTNFRREVSYTSLRVFSLAAEPSSTAAPSIATAIEYALEYIEGIPNIDWYRLSLMAPGEFGVPSWLSNGRFVTSLSLDPAVDSGLGEFVTAIAPSFTKLHKRKPYRPFAIGLLLRAVIANELGVLPRTAEDAESENTMRIYAMSDIHGCLSAFESALSDINLDDGISKLVLLGDYVDRGPESNAVLQRIMKLQECYGERVIALRGNHEEMLLEYIDEVANPDFAHTWMLTDTNLATAKSFLSADDFGQVRHLLLRGRFEDAYSLTVERIKAEHADVIKWIRGLPYYHESDFHQVFVHAGIDEESGDLWRVATPDEWFTAMPPMYAGRTFELDVIAGHTDSAAASGNPDFRGIWHDGVSHYFVDANVMKHGEIAVLIYDCETGQYSGPGLE